MSSGAVRSKLPTLHNSVVLPDGIRDVRAERLSRCCRRALLLLPSSEREREKVDRPEQVSTDCGGRWAGGFGRTPRETVWSNTAVDFTLYYLRTFRAEFLLRAEFRFHSEDAYTFPTSSRISERDFGLPKMFVISAQSML